jgi:hypothetical protein
MIDRHAVVGSWRVSVQIPGLGGPLTNLARFSADGGVAVAFPSPTPAAPGAGHALEYWTTALGEWEATDEHNVRMIFVSLGTDETGAPAGTHTVTATATMDPTLATWAGPFQIAIADANGKDAGGASGTVSAVRINVPDVLPGQG